MSFYMSFFFFNDTATTEIYTLSLHDALPISTGEPVRQFAYTPPHHNLVATQGAVPITRANAARTASPCDEIRSEEHTSELQSRQYLVCRLLLEKKNFI